MLHAMLCDPSLYLHFLVQILCHIGKWRSRCRCQQILHGTDIFCPSPSCSVLSQHSQILPQKNKIKEGWDLKRSHFISSSAQIKWATCLVNQFFMQSCGSINRFVVIL